MLGIVPGQHLAFDLVELHEFFTGPPLRLAKVTLGFTFLFRVFQFSLEYFSEARGQLKASPVAGSKKF